MESKSEALVQNGDRISFSFGKTLYLYFILIPALVFSFKAFTIPLALTTLALIFVTVCVGHSVGLHRGIIHKTYQCSRVARNVLTYLFVHSGLGGPLSWIRLHYVRDYWQNRSDCPKYFQYNHSMLRDFYWNLHFKFTPQDWSIYNIPKEDLEDPWLNWLEKTWHWHIAGSAAIIWLVFGFNALIICVFARLSFSMLGHWIVGFLTHKYGYTRYKIKDAKENTKVENIGEKK